MAGKSKRSLTLYELLIALCSILILYSVFFSYMQNMVRVAKETALTNELSNIRMAIQSFRLVNNRLPEDLKTLTARQLAYAESDGSVSRKPFIAITRINKEGNLLDPFLNIYYYNSADGRVSSQTPGYENW